MPRAKNVRKKEAGESEATSKGPDAKGDAKQRGNGVEGAKQGAVKHAGEAAGVDKKGVRNFKKKKTGGKSRNSDDDGSDGRGKGGTGRAVKSGGSLDAKAGGPRDFKWKKGADGKWTKVQVKVQSSGSGAAASIDTAKSTSGTGDSGGGKKRSRKKNRGGGEQGDGDKKEGKKGGGLFGRGGVAHDAAAKGADAAGDGEKRRKKRKRKGRDGGEGCEGGEGGDGGGSKKQKPEPGGGKEALGKKKQKKGGAGKSAVQLKADDLRARAANDEIAQHANRRELSLALKRFEDATGQGFANSHTYSIMINAHVRCGDPDAAACVLKAMTKVARLAPPAPAPAPAPAANAARARQAGLSPCVVAYTTLINGRCKAGDLPGALEALRAMLARKPPVKPNVRTLNTLLRGCPPPTPAPPLVLTGHAASLTPY